MGVGPVLSYVRKIGKSDLAFEVKWLPDLDVEHRTKGALQPTFGTIDLEAKTRVDRAQRAVFFEEIQITHGSFPSAGAQAENYLATLRTLIPKELKNIALDRMEAGLAILEARQKADAHPPRNDPPTILFSTQPAMLVPADGPAVYRPVEKTGLERVFNTPALILRDQAGKHFTNHHPQLV